MSEAATKEMPASVQIGPMRYTIYHSQEAMDVHNVANRVWYQGVCDHQDQQIIVAGNLAIGQARQTLTHEVLHAINWVYHVRDEDCNDERVVNQLATAWLDTLRRNPSLVAYLTEGAE